MAVTSHLCRVCFINLGKDRDRLRARSSLLSGRVPRWPLDGVPRLSPQAGHRLPASSHSGRFSLQSGGAIVLTLSQTGSVFKPRKAHLPQELLGEVRPRRGPERGRRHGSLLLGLAGGLT